MKIVQLEAMKSPNDWKNLSTLLHEGQTVQIPIVVQGAEQLSALVAEHVKQISHDDLPKLDKVSVDSIRLDQRVVAQVDRREIFVGGVAIQTDTIKGAVVGGGVSGLVLSLTNAAKSTGAAIGITLSCIGLGAVIWPELAERLRKSEIEVGMDKSGTPKVTIKPPPSTTA